MCEIFKRKNSTISADVNASRISPDVTGLATDAPDVIGLAATADPPMNNQHSAKMKATIARLTSFRALPYPPMVKKKRKRKK